MTEDCALGERTQMRCRVVPLERGLSPADERPIVTMLIGHRGFIERCMVGVREPIGMPMHMAFTNCRSHQMAMQLTVIVFVQDHTAAMSCVQNQRGEAR